LNLAEVYATAGRREEAVEALSAGLKFARRDVRLTIAMNRLTSRREPVLSFLGRQHPMNRQLGLLRHRAMQLFGQD
jgi:hypothetical protein